MKIKTLAGTVLAALAISVILYASGNAVTDGNTSMTYEGKLSFLDYQCIFEPEKDYIKIDLGRIEDSGRCFLPLEQAKAKWKGTA
ncbi:MAG: hypothetical protein LBN33_07720 [Desulfovibrio sp.]|jgi:hypothetical protein|nr:hypothetical protein [Desulfovibrio sp.]